VDDLTGKINEILGNPEIMNQIKNFSGLIGKSKSEQNTPENSQKEEKQPDFQIPDDMLETFLKLAPIISSMKSEDKHTRFLKALKPLLSKEKQKKIESSFGILQIIKILPLLKNKGLF
jgi:hypothetical protein